MSDSNSDNSHTPPTNKTTNKSSAGVLKLIRPHQWSKNLLIFSPLFFSGKLLFKPDSLVLWEASLGAFLGFTLVASATYCINDVLDAERDRAHPRKRLRPVASGEITAKFACILGLALALLGFLIGALVSQEVLVLLALYAGLQVVYNKWIKNLPILDIILLSSFFLLRICVGVVATAITPSVWLLIITWLGALMLAAGKRLREIELLGSLAEETRPVLLKYSVHFLRHLISSIGMATLICYLLWCAESVQTGRFSSLEAFPSAIFIAFGLFRYQLLVFTQRFNEDPTEGLIKDIPMVIAGALFAIYVGLIIYY